LGLRENLAVLLPGDLGITAFGMTTKLPTPIRGSQKLKLLRSFLADAAVSGAG
jgi:hypothetical protein